MIKVLVCTVAAAILSTQAAAFVLDGGIIRQNGQGTFVKLSTDRPFAVGADTFDDDNLYAFDEDQNITLDRPIQVDWGGEDGVIPEGTIVASHYVFFDSLAGVQMGYVDFDAPILGIAAFQATMAATDFLANTSIT